MFIYLEFAHADDPAPAERRAGSAGCGSTRFMRRQLRDPEVRRKVWPDYTFGCKRVLFSSPFLPALQRDNVELVTDAIERSSRTVCGPRTARCTSVDCIIWGTGFRTNDFMFPMEITGAAATSLRDAWADGPHAHLGMTVPGFPSLFVMYGPNTNTSGGSIIFYLEAQARYVRQALEHAAARRARRVDVRAEVEAAVDREVQARFARHGVARVRLLVPRRLGPHRHQLARLHGEYEKATKALDPSEYEFL